eukprot:m.128258 g.128258  ORF g.128258 m.128258 type:complete len:57 (-) comp52288_c0_seq4:121-291(-)
MRPEYSWFASMIAASHANAELRTAAGDSCQYLVGLPNAMWFSYSATSGEEKKRIRK